jgi:hypothetical protein
VQIVFIFFCGNSFAQSAALSSAEKLYLFANFSSDYTANQKPIEVKDGANFYTLNPAAPYLTTNAHNLEICDGNSAHLTATSPYTILWYSTPPPLGAPVGTGTSYITPTLNTGYYTYYAVADNNGVKSDVTAMEVVMVYPSPEITVVSSAKNLCANETATLTVSGTTYFEWENGPIASKLIIRPNTTQSYKVTGINTAGCASSAVYTQSVISCDFNTASTNRALTSNLELNEDERLFSVFPNPNNGDFHIRANVISESTRVEIYNSLGALSYSNKIINEESAITLKEFNNGIYIVRIIENDKILKQVKIIKE